MVGRRITRGRRRDPHAQLRLRGDAELAIDVRQMGANGCGCQVQALGDLRGALAIGEGAGDLPLAAAQWFGRLSSKVGAGHYADPQTLSAQDISAQEKMAQDMGVWSLAMSHKLRGSWLSGDLR